MSAVPASKCLMCNTCCASAFCASACCASAVARVRAVPWLSTGAWVRVGGCVLVHMLV